METRRPSPARTPTPLARSRPLAALTVALAVAGCAATNNPIQHVRSTYESTKTGSTRLTTQTNQIDVGIQDHIGPDFEYRFSDKLVQSRQNIDAASGSFDEESTLHRPSLDLILTSGTLRWTQLFQSQQDRTSSGSGSSNTLVRNDILEKLEWTPVDLPEVIGWFNYRTTEDSQFVDQQRLETRLQVTQALQKFGYEYSFRDEYTDDIDVDVQSERVEHLGRVTYQDSYSEDKVSTTVSLFGSERDNTTDVPSGTAPTLQVFPTQAFAAVDTTPQVSSLPPNAALINGNLTTSAGVDIGGFGSGGQISWNMAVQLPPGQAVDRVELVTVSVVPSTFTNQFAFSVWVSEDNVFWTLVKSSAAYVYDSAFQRFRLSIPSVSNRFVKVLNTVSPAGAPAVLISEVETFRTSTTASNNRSTYDESIRSATTNVSWRVADTVTIGADLFTQSAESDANGTTARDEKRVDTGVWGAWTPTEKVDANVRVSDQRVQDPILNDEDLLTLSGVFSYRPIGAVDLDLSLLHSNRTVDGQDDVQNDVANVRSSAQLLPTLRAELSFEHNVTEDSTNQRDIERWIFGAGLIAELTANIDATFRVRNDDATVTGSGSTSIPDPSEDRYEFTVVYRPSEHLIGEAELRWIDNYAGSGLDQRLRLDWIPFGDGALDTQFDYDRTSTHSFGDMTIDRWRTLVRYGFNPYTYLDFQAAVENPDEGPSTQVFTVSFSFSS